MFSQVMRPVAFKLSWLRGQFSAINGAFESRAAAVATGGELQTKFLRWEKTRLGLFKLNTDGAGQPGSGRTCAGGVIRNHEGKWVVGFACSREGAGGEFAEAWAVWQGLCLAWEKGIRSLILECDSLRIVNGWRIAERPLLEVIKACLEVLEREWEVEVVPTAILIY